MSGIYILASRSEACKIVEWLSREGEISPADVSAFVDYPDLAEGEKYQLPNIAVIGFKHFREILSPVDIVLVAGRCFNEAVSELFAGGFNNIYDGQAILEKVDLVHRFNLIAAPYHIGPNYPELLDESFAFHRYTSKPISVHQIPRHKLFVVNSMPKSGTVWMIAMLERLLGVKARQQIKLSHVMDVGMDVKKPNVHGAVVLVRDLRDVVVSWYHDLARCDLRNGFAEPRYTDITEFYFDHMIGFLNGSSRYAFGDLERWIDLVTYNSFPVVRYEDLINDTPYWLKKVMNYWKISVTEDMIDEVANSFAFHRMQLTLSEHHGYIPDLVKSGHLRKGAAGSWESELPPLVAEDIQRRFSVYQQRLRYD